MGGVGMKPSLKLRPTNDLRTFFPQQIGLYKVPNLQFTLDEHNSNFHNYPKA